MWQLRTSKGQTIPLGRLPGVLGSAAGADVRVPHASVQPQHARLSLDAGGALLVVAADDQAVLGLDGKRVRRARLLGGETLVIGRLQLRVEAPAAVSPAAPTSTGPRPPDDEIPDLVPRRPAPAAAQATASARTPAGARPAGKRARAGGAKAPKRHRGQALVVARHERRGLLGTDLSQLSLGVRLGLVAGVVLVAALVAWGLGWGVDALG